MRPLTRADILTADAYERERGPLRGRLMVLKERRRVPVGDECSVHFENRDTIRYQIHEMLRVEQSWDRSGAVEAELEAYNPLIPASGELSATVMFEYNAPEVRKQRLSDLVGIDQHLRLVVGDTAPLLAEFDRMQISEGRVSAVQFVKWRLDAHRRALLTREGTVVRLIVDHPRYRARSVLSEQTRKEIAADLEA